MIELGAGESIHHTYAETEALNPGAMNEMLEKYGVTNRRWTDQELAAFEKAWLQVLEEDPRTTRIQEGRRQLFGVAQEYKTWGDAQALKATYLSQ